MGMSAVFALCVRSSGSHLPRVLKNLKRLSRLYDRNGFVFVEGDSTDDSKAILKAWAAERPDATVIELDGLDASHPKRTDRLAYCRNAYIDFIRASPLAAFDQLVILDADDINRPPIDLVGFARARDWLTDNDAAAVFANSLPFYYDIFALRHPTWCPRDMIRDIRSRPEGMDRNAARQRYVRDRQIPIPTAAAPIEVQSAFGGLAIYRMADALAGARYVGLTNSGREVCEHVRFNLRVARAGGRRLFILPWMTIGKRDVALYSEAERRVTLEHAGRSCELSTAMESAGEAPPAGARRLARLARLIGEVAPGTAAIDVGAGVGADIALCRMEGASLRFVAVEPSLSRYKHLTINCRNAPDLFDGVQTVWAQVGPAEAPGTQDLGSAPHASLQALAASNALSLVKLAAGGDEPAILQAELDFLQQARPAVWADLTVSRSGDRDIWTRLLRQAQGAWPFVAAFDHQGRPLLAGKLTSDRQRIAELFTPSADPVARLALIPERFAEICVGWLAKL